MEAEVTKVNTYVACTDCQCVSSLKDLFVKQARTDKDICPGCQVKRLTSSGRIKWLLVPVAIIILELLIVDSPDVDALYIFLFLAWAFFFTAVAIILHEYSHWAVTRMLGGMCPVVTFGEGVAIFTIRTRNTLWQFCPSPSLGLAYCVYPPGKQDVWRRILTLLAGGLANLLAALIAFYIAYDILDNNRYSFYWYAISLINGIFFATNLLFPTKRNGLKTDGQQILAILRDKSKFTESSFRQFQYVIAQALVLRESIDELFDYINSCDKYAESAILCHLLGYSFYHRYDMDNFISWSERSLNLIQEGKDPSFPEGDRGEYVKAIVKNNIAFGLYCSGSTDKQRMKELTEDAFDKVPWESAIIGTYAACKIRGDEPEEGISLIEEQIASKSESRKRNRALSFLCLAEGYQKQNRLDDMRNALSEINMIDPEVLDHMKPLLERVQNTSA